MKPAAILRTRATGTSYSAEATAYFAAMSVQPDATRKGLIDTCISGLKTDGVWTKLDWFCLLALGTQQAGLLNAINPAKSVTMPGASFVVDRGVKCSAVGNGYVTIGETFNNSPNQFAQNSACVGVWCNLEGSASGGLRNQIGETLATDRILMNARNDAGNETFRLNDGTDDTLQANTGSRTGHRTLSRTGAAIKRGFMNGVRTANLTTASVGVGGGNGCWCRDGGNIYDDRLAAVYSGAGLSDTEVGNLHSRLSTFLTAIGAN